MTKRVLQIVILLTLALIITAAVYYYDDTYRFVTSREALADWLARYGRYSPILFIFLQIVQVIIAPIPGEVTGMVGGYLYGAFWGSVYSSIGLTVGSVIAFALARSLGEPLVERFIKKELLTRYDHFLAHRGLVLAFIFFLIPGFPKDALCYVLGLSHIRLLPFIGVCTIGRLLGTTGLAISGALLRELGDFHISAVNGWLVAAFAGIAILLLALFLGRRRLLDKLHLRDKKSENKT